MTALWIALIVVGALLVLGGIFLKPLWRVAVRPFYRHPAAQEPSKLGWGARSAVMIFAGVISIVLSVGLLGSTAPDPPTPPGTTSQECSDLVEQVDSPSSASGADQAVRDAADQAGFDVEREESTSETVTALPSGDETITVTVTTWVVRDGSDTVATFTWTSSDSVLGRFSAEQCP
jgi:hypothetical protein